MITFTGVHVLNSFECSSTSLHVVADNKLVSFDVLSLGTSLVRSPKWLVASSCVDQLDLFYLGESAGGTSSHGSAQDVFGSAIPVTEGPFRTVGSGHTQFVLENLGIIRAVTMFDDECIAVLCHTDSVFRVLVLRVSELDVLVRRSSTRSKKAWHGRSKADYNVDSDDNEDDDNEDNSDTHGKVDVGQLAKSHRASHLRDVRLIYWLGHTFLAVYGSLVKLLDEDLRVLRVWALDARVECLKEIRTSRQSEVWC